MLPLDFILGIAVGGCGVLVVVALYTARMDGERRTTEEELRNMRAAAKFYRQSLEAKEDEIDDLREQIDAEGEWWKGA